MIRTLMWFSFAIFLERQQSHRQSGTLLGDNPQAVYELEIITSTTPKNIPSLLTYGTLSSFPMGMGLNQHQVESLTTPFLTRMIWLLSNLKLKQSLHSAMMTTTMKFMMILTLQN